MGVDGDRRRSATLRPGRHLCPLQDTTTGHSSGFNIARNIIRIITEYRKMQKLWVVATKNRNKNTTNNDKTLTVTVTKLNFFTYLLTISKTQATKGGIGS